MSFLPNAVSRTASRVALKVSANSPTILVISGVVGFGVTAVLAARAAKKGSEVIEHHVTEREDISSQWSGRAEQKAVVALYASTSRDLVKVYGPTIVLGTLSAASILTGHRILKTRHIATMIAYSGLQEQFKSYRNRVARTLGENTERDIYNGAHGEWTEDPERKGEYKLTSKYDETDRKDAYLRPWFDETNPNWVRDPYTNYLFLKGVQAHMNNILQVRGHVFLNDVLDSLKLDRKPEGAVAGWLLDNEEGDNFIDFGFMTSNEPNSVAFRNHVEGVVRLNFNIDGVIWDRI